jgi:aspartyl-tRNA(Asn)/glutamyl-tRNA(Gln) amidotransferase subunit B
VANWLLGPIVNNSKQSEFCIQTISLQAAVLADLIKLVEDGKVNFSVASSKGYQWLFAENQ